MPAGIPLDLRGIKYGDQDRPDGGFEDFQNIEFEFECEDGMCASFPSALGAPVSLLRSWLEVSIVTSNPRTTRRRRLIWDIE